MASTNPHEHSALERAIFDRFAEDAGLIVRAQRITQPNPPDILCEVEGLGQVAFELVQLDDPDELQRMEYLRRVREFWADATGPLPTEALQRHRGAQINIAFEPTADQRERRAALKLIASTLSKMPEAAEGAVFEPLPRGVISADLEHFPATDGPLIFEVSGYQVRASAVPGDAPIGIHLSRIDEKIAYYPDGWGMRAELLAYPRWGFPFSDQMHRAGEYLADRFPAGIFSRGWIYELNSRDVVACAP